MNRKQRRAALKQSSPVGADRRTAGDPAIQLFAEAEQLQQQQQARRRRARLQAPADCSNPIMPKPCNNLGLVLQAQGKRNEASARFAQALTLMPQLFEQFGGICQTLVAVLPPIGDAMRRALAAWPNRLTADQLLGGAGLAAICNEPGPLAALHAAVDAGPRHRARTRPDVAARRAARRRRQGRRRRRARHFACALATQCFINEYVFATTPDEDAEVERLAKTVADARAPHAPIAPATLAALAMYRPLSCAAGRTGAARSIMAAGRR